MKTIARHLTVRITRAPLSAAVALALAASASLGTSAWAQETGCEEIQGTPPGLYVTTDEGHTFLVQGDKLVELAPGQSGFASEDKLTCITNPPDILDWPCSTDAARSRKFATYAITEITSKNVAAEVVRRYFEVPEVIEPIPNWIEGESHTSLDINDIIQFSSPEYWYHPNTAVDILDERRPKVLLISLFVGINQVVIDNYTIDALRKFYAGQPLPVVFVFNDSNAVPVSYFGANASLEEISRAFNERRIKLADVPMWQLGDYHLSPTSNEFEKLFDLPELEDIDPVRREALGAQLETYGFKLKPVFVTMLEESDKLYVDDPELVRVAISMGYDRLPAVINFVEQDSHLRRCGPGTPVGSHGVSGGSTPIGGPTVPPGGSTPPPTQPASDS